MIITAVQPRRRSLYQLWLDGAEGPQVDKLTFDEAPYAAGSAITAAALEALLETSQYNRTRDRALYLLGQRDYACRELEKKLAADAPPAVAAAVVARLRELSLLDDARYAARKAADWQQYKQYSRGRVVQELRRRGVDPDIARAAADELPGEDFQQALALIEKKYYNKLDSEDSRRRVAAALARRGFSYSAIRRAMEACGGADDDSAEEQDDSWL